MIVFREYEKELICCIIIVMMIIIKIGDLGRELSLIDKGEKQAARCATRIRRSNSSTFSQRVLVFEVAQTDKNLHMH